MSPRNFLTKYPEFCGVLLEENGEVTMYIQRNNYLEPFGVQEFAYGEFRKGFENMIDYVRRKFPNKRRQWGKVI